MSNKNKKNEEMANSLQCMEILKKFNAQSTIVAQVKTYAKDAKKSKTLDGKKKN